jgi:G3E family GTPase
MAQVLIACIGGFLGAGKTTALASAARELISRGLKVGIITNDQGEQLIDTRVMRAHGLTTEEIVGGCFCCKFEKLVEHAERILDQGRPDVILAEAVGSCTDLSATVYQPLRKYYASRFDLAPLSILVEPARIRGFFGSSESSFPETVEYLIKKQLAEADLIVLNKSDLVDRTERQSLHEAIKATVGEIPSHEMSALTGAGVSGWVDRLLDGRTAGTRILEIDYNTYAEAEASLGWLNATVEITSASNFSPQEAGKALLEKIRTRCLDENAAIAHLKILIATVEGSDRIALTESRGEAQWSEGKQFAPVSEALVIVNARVCLAHEKLKQIVEESLVAAEKDLQVTSSVQNIESFSPSPPRPTHRFKKTAAEAG